MNDETPALTQPPMRAQDSSQPGARAQDASPPEANAPSAAADIPDTDNATKEETVMPDEPDRAAAPPADEPPRAEAAAVAPAPARSNAVAWWALLVALAAAGCAGFAAWQARDTHLQGAVLREELAQRLAEGASIASEARGIVRQQQEALASLQGKFGALESKLETTEGQANALEALYQEFSRSREDGVLAEVEQTMAIAVQQLQLAGNVESALIALQQADARLAEYDRGQFAPLRRALVADIDLLKLQPVVDVSGVGVRLEKLLEQTDELPLAFESQPPQGAAEPPAEVSPDSERWYDRSFAYARALAIDVWHEIRGLVRVERLDESDPVLLAPAQNTFLRENLKIRLLTARLALVARDARSYAADVEQARSWVERFFDLRDERVRLALEELKRLEEVSVRRELPTLNDSFAALRSLQVRNEHLPAVVPSPEVPLPGGASAAPPSAPEVAPAPAPAAESAPPVDEPPTAPATGADASVPESEAAPEADAPASPAADDAAEPVALIATPDGPPIAAVD